MSKKIKWATYRSSQEDFSGLCAKYFDEMFEQLGYKKSYSEYSFHASALYRCKKRRLKVIVQYDFRENPTIWVTVELNKFLNFQQVHIWPLEYFKNREAPQSDEEQIAINKEVLQRYYGEVLKGKEQPIKVSDKYQSVKQRSGLTSAEFIRHKKR